MSKISIPSLPKDHKMPWIHFLKLKKSEFLWYGISETNDLQTYLYWSFFLFLLFGKKERFPKCITHIQDNLFIIILLDFNDFQV